VTAQTKNHKQTIGGKNSVFWVDSILKYDRGIDVKMDGWVGNDSSDEAAMFITNANGLRVAVIGVENEIWYSYKKENGGWVITDSFQNGMYPFDMCLADLNGDGFKDMRFRCPVMRGNYVCTVLLYQPQTKTFRHDSSYDLMNIEYDPTTHMVRSSALGGLFDNRKELYKISGDSLIFYKRVEMSIDNHNKGKLLFYGNVNGKEALVKTIKKDGTSIEKQFYRTYWSGYLDYFDQAECQ